MAFLDQLQAIRFQIGIFNLVEFRATLFDRSYFLDCISRLADLDERRDIVVLIVKRDVRETFDRVKERLVLDDHGFENRLVC